MRRVLVAVLCAAFSCATLAQEKLLVQVPAEYDPGLRLPEEKKKACEPERHLGRHVLEHVQTWMPNAAIGDGGKPATGLNLRLMITGLDGYGEGAKDPVQASIFSVSIRAELYDGPMAVAATVLRRRSMAGHPSNCDATNKIVRVLGSDVSIWLRKALPAKPGQ